MKTLRRYNFRHRDYFITAVTYDRQPLLMKDLSLFWNSWENYELIAWVVLPDHFHAILNTRRWTLSEIVHRFKIRYSRRYRDRAGSGRVWQNRFWDHLIRNETDFARHVDYIHYNPVRHGLVADPFDWEHSSIHAYQEQGYYQQDLSSSVKKMLEGEYGE